MIIIKSEKDLKDIKQAGKIWKKTKDYIISILDKNPYHTLLELDELINNFIISNGAVSTFFKMYDFPKHVCISVNDCIIHGIPDNYMLKDGDKVTFDIGVTFNGHICDAAFIYLMPNCSEEMKKISQVCQDSLKEALKFVKAGNHIGDIGYAIEQFVTKEGYYILDGFTGHGCGNKLHEDPPIYNVGSIGTGPILKKNMVICIEPMIMSNSGDYYIKNGWNVIAKNNHLTAHVEDMILVTEDGYEILNN